MSKTVSCIPEVMERAAAELAAVHREGESIPLLYLPGNAGRISCVEEHLFENASAFSGVRVYQTLALGPSEGWTKAVAQGVIPVTPFVGPGIRKLVNDGLALNIHSHLSDIPRQFAKRWRPDVAIAHVSPPNKNNQVTLGLNAGLDYTAVKSARYKIAVVNSNMPRWSIQLRVDPATGRHINCGCAMDLDEFDLVVQIEEPLLEHLMVPKESQQKDAEAIAAHIMELLERDADAQGNLPHTLQFGIGTIPNALAHALARGRKRIGRVWTEVLTEGVRQLYELNLIAHVDGVDFRDRIVTGFVLGSRQLYAMLHENPHVLFVPQEHVNHPAMIMHNDWMVSVNSAIAVSLAGEVVASNIDKRYHSGVGGQHDFALGASWSKRGMAIIALPSTLTRKGGSLGSKSLESKIVLLHREGAHHTISSDLPIVVITENGVADLRGLDDTQRVEAMLKVAHPDWRIPLAKEARRQLPSMQGIGAIPPRLTTLRNGCQAVVRPATKNDMPGIKAYISQFSVKDMQTRYMYTASPEQVIEYRMKEWGKDDLDFVGHAAIVIVKIGEMDDEIIGIAQAFRLQVEGHYEISFSRRSDWGGQGIGPELMSAIIDWAVASGALYLEAMTYRTENPRMRALFDRFGFASGPYPDDHMIVRYHSKVEDLARAQ